MNIPLKKYFLLGTILLLGHITMAQQWKPSTYSVSFSIKHAMGSTAKGSFKNLAATINFDPANLTTAKIIASVETSTFKTGSDSRDKTVKGEDYFNVVKYPKIEMKLLSVKKLKENTFSGTFVITIKGIAKEITFTFSFVEKGNSATFKGGFTINRLDFSIGESSWLVGDEAKVEILLNTIK